MKKSFVFAVFFTFMCSFLSAEGEETLSLSLEDCIIRALRDNLKVAVEVYNPEIADVSVTRAKEVFMPQLELSYLNRHTESPSYWWLEAAEVSESDYADASLSLNQKIPFGGNLSLNLESYRSTTNQGFQLLDPRYGSTLTFSFVQPLLKDFGFKMGRKEIIIAQNNLEVSRNQLKSILLETISSVQEAYWNLTYAVENLKVKQQSLQLAKDLLEKNKKEVEVGKLAPIEILNAETVVASREADILQAEALVKRGEDVLKNILNIAEEEGVPSKIITLLDKPTFVKREVTLAEALTQAYAYRPDLEVTRTNISTSEFNVSVAKNQMLPGLDLNLSYWSPGLSGDRILYLNDNPFLGIVIGKEEGRAADSIRDAFKFLYQNLSVSVTLSLPLSNIFTKAELAKANLELEKNLLELENLEKQVLLEVKDAVREIETNAKRVEAYRVARELAERRLEAEEKKLHVGLTTNYFVLEYQEALATARSNEIKALVDYNLAWAKLEKATGVSLDSRNIRIDQLR
jgi:outer membrane protein TolC